VAWGKTRKLPERPAPATFFKPAEISSGIKLHQKYELVFVILCLPALLSEVQTEKSE
jgi:hypothetical protein